jgi:hypothetical protein
VKNGLTRKVLVKRHVLAIAVLAALISSFTQVNQAISQPNPTKSNKPSNPSSTAPSSLSICIDKKTGNLRSALKCKDKERSFVWKLTSPQGIQGSTGKRGPQGKPGKNGKPGTSVLSGNGVPTLTIGVEGEFYIDLQEFKIYGPKVGQDWGLPKDLLGKSGANGSQGPAGAQGKDGQTIVLNDGGFAQLVLANTATDAYQLKFSDGFIWSYQPSSSTSVSPLILSDAYNIGFESADCSGDLIYFDFGYQYLLDKYIYLGHIKIPNTIEMTLDASDPAFYRTDAVAGKVIGRSEDYVPINSYLSGTISSGYNCVSISNTWPPGSYLISPKPGLQIPGVISRPFQLRD